MLFLLIDLYSLVLFAAIVLSWVNVPEDNPFVRLVRQLTEPVLGQVRKILPTVGSFDFSPLVVILGLRVLEAVLRRL